MLVTPIMVKEARYTQLGVFVTPNPGPVSAVALPFATLLLRLAFRSLLAGDVGLLSAPLLPFLAEPVRFVVLISGAAGRLVNGEVLGAV